MGFVHDPGLGNLRRGLRAAVVVPVLYFAMGAASDDVAALYAAFGAFSALVFADFQGTPRRKLEGYGTLAVLGAGLILLGSAIADLPVVPAIAIFAVTFAIRFGGCLGGYAVAAGTTLMLAFALAVLSTPVTHLDQRIIGWAVGCAVAALASLVAPMPLHIIARDRLAAQCRAIGGHLRAIARGEDPPPLDVSPVRQVREEMALATTHPLSATARQSALRGLLDALGRATLICQHLPSSSHLDDGHVGTSRLAEVAADTYDATARAITDGIPVDLAPVDDELTRQRRTMIAALTDADDPTRRSVVERTATTTMRVRFAAALGAVAGAMASSYSGHPLPDDVHIDAEVAVPRRGAGPFWARARRTLGFHFRWQSTRFRNSLRAGIALAASLGIARLVDFDHAFWVVLGTLMVLRSGVSDTTTTALQALRGTLIGFAIAAPLAYAANGQDGLLWVLLPFVSFLAAWAPGAIGLGTGQAAFTLFVVVLFNLAVPAGTQTAVIRLETVFTGIVVAVVAGFLFWPRGPEASLGPIAAKLYRASARTIQAVSVEVLGLPGGHEGLLHARHELDAAKEELEETMQELAADRRADVEIADRVAILTPPALVRAGDWARIDLAGGTIARDAGAPDHAAPALEARAFEVGARFDAVANWLDDPDEAVDPLTDEGTAAPSSDGLDGPQFLRQVWLWSWLTTVDNSLVHTSTETVRTVRSLPRRWWR